MNFLNLSRLNRNVLVFGLWSRMTNRKFDELNIEKIWVCNAVTACSTETHLLTIQMNKSGCIKYFPACLTVSDSYLITSSCEYLYLLKRDCLSCTVRDLLNTRIFYRIDVSYCADGCEKFACINVRHQVLEPLNEVPVEV